MAELKSSSVAGRNREQCCASSGIGAVGLGKPSTCHRWDFIKQQKEGLFLEKRDISLYLYALVLPSSDVCTFMLLYVLCVNYFQNDAIWVYTDIHSGRLWMLLNSCGDKNFV